MEIITALVGVSFALFLAALAVTPNLIAVHLELRAQKRHGAQQNASGLLAAYPPPVPFNYPQIFWRSARGVAKRRSTKRNIQLRNRDKLARFGIQSPGFEPRHGHVRRGNDFFKASGGEQATD